MKQEEHYNQVAVVQWAAYQAKKYPGLGLLYAIPNAARRSLRQGAWMKSEGLRAGVPDLCLPVPRGTFHGLYLEMKSMKGKTTKEQGDWLNGLAKQGYKTAVCHGAEEAIHVIQAYLEAGI